MVGRRFRCHMCDHSRGHTPSLLKPKIVLNDCDRVVSDLMLTMQSSSSDPMHGNTTHV